MKTYSDLNNAIDQAIDLIPIYYKNTVKHAIENLKNSVKNNDLIGSEEALNIMSAMGINTTKIASIANDILDNE